MLLLMDASILLNAARFAAHGIALAQTPARPVA
jgi:hypothetical protein